MKFSLFSVLLTFFIDNFGLAIAYPIFTPLFLEAGGLFATQIPFFQRTFLLGLLVAFFPLAQFFGAPLIGELSDRKGRKKAFTYTIFAASLGYALTALGILFKVLWLLFLGRLWAGFFAGNLTICLAAIADMSKEEETRAKNFGLLGAVGGFSFLIAIVLSGLLTVNPSFPFWIASLLSLINLGCMLLLFQESHPSPRTQKFSLFLGISHIISAFAIPRLRRIYVVFFLFMICWVTSMQFLPAYFLENYGATHNGLILLFVSIGLTWSLSNLLINRLLARYFHSSTILLVCLFLLAALLFAFLFSHSLLTFLSIFLLATLCSSLSWTNCLTTVSLSASAEIQGRSLGINQSVGALAAIVGPTLGGIIIGIDLHLLYLFTALICLSAALFFYTACKKEKI